MHFVYILYFFEKKKYYTGLTKNIERRIKEHRNRDSKIARDLGNFKLIFVAMFTNKIVAGRFEKYLKSHSGRAFRNKRLVDQHSH